MNLFSLQRFELWTGSASDILLSLSVIVRLLGVPKNMFVCQMTNDAMFVWIWFYIFLYQPIWWPSASNPIHSMYDLCSLNMVWDEHPFVHRLSIVLVSLLHFGYCRKRLDLNWSRVVPANHTSQKILRILDFDKSTQLCHANI